MPSTDTTTSLSQTQKKIRRIQDRHRSNARDVLEPLADEYYPEMLRDDDGDEFRKMVELSAKMMIVGQSCTEINNADFNKRRVMISALFGGCCFLGDSFIDDFDEATTLAYLDKLQMFLDKGWFECTNNREKLFYVIINRLFAERDVFRPQIRQAIYGQFLAQKKDCLWRIYPQYLQTLSYKARCRALLQCARDRGGYVMLVLSLFLVPELDLGHQHLLYRAGELFMHIDDHGDYHQDIFNKRNTFMNNVKSPVRTLKKIFGTNISALSKGLPDSNGKTMLISFLVKYLNTRLEKKKREKERGDTRWVIYE